MPEQVTTPFTAWRFEDDGERVRAQTFTDLQTKYLQTLLAEAMGEKMLIGLDPTEQAQALQLFAFKHEYLRGRVELLAELLGISQDQKNALAAYFKKQRESQQTSP